MATKKSKPAASQKGSAKTARKEDAAKEKSKPPAKAAESPGRSKPSKPAGSAKPEKPATATKPKPTTAKKPGKQVAAVSAKPPTRPAKQGKPRATKTAVVTHRPTPATPASAEPSETEAPREHLPLAELRKVKTGLSRKDLEQFRQFLLEKRAEIVGDVMAMQSDARKSGGGELSSMPLHMADIGSDNYEQEFTLVLVESERALIGEIDDALCRITDGTYGVCLESGKPIEPARLEIKPWARYSIEVARERERRGLM